MKEKNEELKLSIIISNYKPGKHLDESIKSIINNVKGHTYEIIVLDYNSTDDSKKQIEEYTKKHDNISGEYLNGGGFGKGLNAGVEKSNGQYIFFLESNSNIKENVSKLVEVADEKKSDIVLGRLQFTDGKEQTGSRRLFKKPVYNTNADKTPAIFARSSHEATLYRGELLKNIRYPEIGAYDNFAGTFQAYYDAKDKISIVPEAVASIDKIGDIGKYNNQVDIAGYLGAEKYLHKVLASKGQTFKLMHNAIYKMYMFGQLFMQDIGYGVKNFINDKFRSKEEVPVTKVEDKVGQQEHKLEFDKASKMLDTGMAIRTKEVSDVGMKSTLGVSSDESEVEGDLKQ